MANLIQIAEELEYMPKDQLAQMTQDPNSTYPQFLVLSEIQRRTQLEKAYQAQATQAEPQTTVAEETVAEFMAPQGLQGMAQQPMPQDMPAPMPESPMQMMADGGRTGFYGLGSTSYGGGMQDAYSVDNSLSLADSETIDVASIPEETRAEIVETSKGLTPAQKAMIGINAVSLALMVAPVPGARVAAGLLKLGSLVPRGLQAGRAAYQARKAKILMDQGRKAINAGKVSGTSRTAPYNPEVVRQAGVNAIQGMRIPQRTIAGGIAAGTAYNLFESENEENKPVTSPVVTDLDDTDKIIDKDTGGTKTKESGLFSNITPDQGLTMAQLGGVLMGARNMSELGTGIAGVAGQMQERKSAAGLSGAQQAYYEGQVRKIDSEIADMPKEAIREQMSMLIKASEAGLITDINLANAEYAALAKRLAVLEGQEIQPASQDANVIASYG
tara:strand:- start:574 stop:1902 length:1329 start_codon:yes stop_codon:yes gene_type:complete